MPRWYTRPLVFVADVEAALEFYVEGLGFTEAWSFPDDSGRKFVAQVERDDTEIILSSQWPEKRGKAMLFIELTPDDWKPLAEALATRGVDHKWGWWGYRSLIVADPDGNELYFPDPEDPGDGQNTNS